MKKFFSCLFLTSCFTVAACAQTGIDYYQKIRLSPEPSAVNGTRLARVSLNGNWNFEVKEQGGSHLIKVPGEWEMQGFRVNEGETAIYTKALDIPDEWQGKRIKLRFDGVSSHALVRLNGHTVAEHEGSFVPFEADITDYLHAEKNILTVEVQAHTISDVLACTSQYAAHTVGGLLRDVTMFALPGVNIAGFDVNTVFDKQYKNAVLQLHPQLANETAASAKAVLRYMLTDENGKRITQKEFSSGEIAGGGTLPLQNTIAIHQPQQWNPEHPYLYRLTTELIVNGKVRQTNRQKVGFRQVEIKGNILLVNGRLVKLRGVCRHSTDPLTGRSVSYQEDVEDVVLFRDANCNYIRTSHYPPSEAFLNACDSLGLFVESESSLCWIDHESAPIWRLWNYKDEKFLPYMLRANIEKMLAGRNHPSVIIWSLGNESVWSPLWDSVNTMVKAFDPSRPTTFHDQCWGEYNNAGSKADIAVYHYPGLNGPQACDTMTRPVLFGEYAHISCYNRRELLTDPGIRNAYGKPLEQMYDSMYAHPANLGGAIWSGIDDIFHMPDGRLVGYGPWGPIDGWRRPKPEYWGMKKAYTPVRVLNAGAPVIINHQLQLQIENRYDFTDLKKVKIECIIDGIGKTVELSIPPHGNGTLSIPVTDSTKEVYITFTDPRGFICNEEKIMLHTAHPEINTAKQQITMQENNNAYFIRQGTALYEVSKTTGLMTTAVRNGQTVLSQGPVFCIVPANDDDGGKPTIASESYQNDIALLKDYSFTPLFAKTVSAMQTSNGVEITAEIVFREGNGSQSYFFGNNGEITVSYNIKCETAETPRQYGMLFQLPESFDKISWERKGAFTVYPADDIARNEGSAMLNAKRIKPAEAIGEGPSGSWKDDANEYGSNDFRATKQNIYTAALSDKNNNTVRICSDGTQAVRSWLQDKHIQLLVADYSSNGSEPFYGSPFSSKRLQLKDKTLKGKVTFVISTATTGDQ